MGARRRVGLWLALLGAVIGITAGLSWASRTPRPALAQRLEAAAAPGRAVTLAGAPQEPVPQRRTIEVVARRYAFEPNRIEVHENDLVKIVFSAEDIPHSFTIDAYRIAKRAAPGRPVIFEFRAEQAGTYVFYCNLTAEEGCRRMRGELIVVRPQ